MNSVLERVNTVCQNVRKSNSTAISFKKLIGITRTEFKDHDFNLILKTKKEKSLENDHFYVNAYYDADDDFNQETPIEVYIHHNFNDNDKFQATQITDFLIQIFDAVVHELRHQRQSRSRNYAVYSEHTVEPHSKYLADPDELDAYAFSIAIELLRALPLIRIKRYMSRVTVLSKMRQGTNYISPNLRAYVQHYNNNPLLKRLARKVYKQLETLDSRHIFK
jgi:hypothetical protein